MTNLNPDTLMSLKVTELRAELRKRKLPATGLKQVLVDRLREHLLKEQTGQAAQGAASSSAMEGAIRPQQRASALVRTAPAQKAVPVQEEARPVPEETDPAGQETTPVGEETRPIPEETNPVGQETTPVGEETKPVSEETKPVGQEIAPVGEETKPVSEETKIGRAHV